MSKVILNEALRSQLNGLNQEVEICDPDGRTVGHYVPVEQYKKMLYAWAESQSGITMEELQRRRHENKGKGRPLADILKDLGAE
jgi:hypothetical protein